MMKHTLDAAEHASRLKKLSDFLRVSLGRQFHENTRAEVSRRAAYVASKGDPSVGKVRLVRLPGSDQLADAVAATLYRAAQRDMGPTNVKGGVVASYVFWTIDETSGGRRAIMMDVCAPEDAGLGSRSEFVAHLADLLNMFVRTDHHNRQSCWLELHRSPYSHKDAESLVYSTSICMSNCEEAAATSYFEAQKDCDARGMDATYYFVVGGDFGGLDQAWNTRVVRLVSCRRDVDVKKALSCEVGKKLVGFVEEFVREQGHRRSGDVHWLRAYLHLAKNQPLDVPVAERLCEHQFKHDDCRQVAAEVFYKLQSDCDLRGQDVVYCLEVGDEATWAKRTNVRFRCGKPASVSRAQVSVVVSETSTVSSSEDDSPVRESGLIEEFMHDFAREMDEARSEKEPGVYWVRSYGDVLLGPRLDNFSYSVDSCHEVAFRLCCGLQSHCDVNRQDRLYCIELARDVVGWDKRRFFQFLVEKPAVPSGVTAQAVASSAAPVGRRGSTHYLKSWPAQFDLVDRGLKRYEVRLDDRGFAVGDTVVLAEWDPKKAELAGRELHGYTGRMVAGSITCMTRGSDLMWSTDGVVLGKRPSGHEYVVLGVEWGARGSC